MLAPFCEKTFGTFQKISWNISENLLEHFKKTLGTFQKNSRNISEKLSEHFKKNSRNISEKLSEHFRKTLGTFPKISRNFSEKLSEQLESPQLHILMSRTYPSLDVQLFLLSLCRWSNGTESSL